MDYLLKCLRAAAIGMADMADNVGEGVSDHPVGAMIFVGLVWATVLVIAISPVVGVPLALIIWGDIIANGTDGGEQS